MSSMVVSLVKYMYKAFTWI